MLVLKNNTYGPRLTISRILEIERCSLFFSLSFRPKKIKKYKQNKKKHNFSNIFFRAD